MVTAPCRNVQAACIPKEGSSYCGAKAVSLGGGRETPLMVMCFLWEVQPCCLGFPGFVEWVSALGQGMDS